MAEIREQSGYEEQNAIEDLIQDAPEKAEVAEQPPKKRARKSRSDGTGSPGTDAVAKGKGKRRRTAGSLSEMMNMPLDVFLEVAAHLHPLDMLNLARTSKSFRSVVLAQSSRTAWIASLTSVDSLPSCPSNMSEPLYAALLFDHHCFLCGVERARWVDYAIRLRLCKACYKANIRKGSSILGKGEVYLFRTLPLFPCETGSDHEKAETLASPQNRTAGKKYYTAHVNAIIDQYTTLERQDPKAAKLLKEEALENVAMTQLHAVAVLAWLKRNSVLKDIADLQAISARKSEIVEHLQKLGYTTHDFPEGEGTWEKLVRQPKLLTERIWNNIRPKLEELIAIEKDRRIQQVFQNRVDDRLDVLVSWYEEHLKDHFTDAERSLMPNFCDARELPSLLTLARANDARGLLPRSAFLAVTEEMLADIEEYKARSQRALADILCTEREWQPQISEELKAIPAADILQRYCAYFRCTWRCHAVVDGCEYLTYEQLHAHWRAAHSNASWLKEDDTYDRVTVAAFWPFFLPSVGRNVLEAVGIPLDTPRVVLDGWVKEGRLFCACEHPGMAPPAEMDWGKLLSHLLNELEVYHRREFEMNHLSESEKHRSNHVLRKSHSVAAGEECCFKFLPEGADTTEASVRTTIDDACREQIEAKIAAPPEPGASAVCRICKGLTRKTAVQVRLNLHNMRVPARPEEFVWHLRTCHGKEFEKRDILFVPR